MSRTEGVSLPRLPTSHTRVTSSHAIQPVSARGAKSDRNHRRALSEPSYTAYVGTPRQDVPHHVYHNAAMYDDVFDKQGKLFVGRNTPKIVSPLNTIGYSSLHDPHCRKLFLNNRKLRSHLMSLGLITDDLKVVASTAEQRQKIRAHELLERKEQLILKLEQQEKERLERLQQRFSIPPSYRETVMKEQERKARMAKLESIKITKIMKEEERKKDLEEKRKGEKKMRLQQAMENARLSEQAHRNAERAQQEYVEMAAYERVYNKHGKQLAKWHRDSDIIHNRMIMMERKHWAKMRNAKESRHTRKTRASSKSSEVDVMTVPVPTAEEEEEEEEEESQHDAEEHQAAPLQEAVPEVVEKYEQKAFSEPVETAAVDHDDASKMMTSREQPQEPSGVQPPSDAGRGQENQASEAAAIIRVEGNQHSEDDEPATGDRRLGEAEAGVVILDQDQSALEFTQILVDTFESVDHDRSGYLSVDSIIQVLDSRDLGLQLVEEELLYIVGQVDVYGNGTVPYAQLAQALLDILLQLYNERAQICIEQYGGYTEEQWCEIFPPKGSEMCYLHKLSGVLQYGRPDDFRPTLRDDVFEESIVDFFEATDSNKDGVIDYEDFYALLLSPMVTTRVYSNQMEELLQLYQNLSFEGRMTLEQFAEVARVLLLMIYQNTFPDVEEWIELQCRKFGTFWFNKNTGETHLPDTAPASPQQQQQQPLPLPPARTERSADEERPATSKAQRKKSRKSRTAEPPPSSSSSSSYQEHGQALSQGSPPPLRKRVSRTTSSNTREQRPKEEDHSTSKDGGSAASGGGKDTLEQRVAPETDVERAGGPVVEELDSEEGLSKEKLTSDQLSKEEEEKEEAKTEDIEQPLTEAGDKAQTDATPQASTSEESSQEQQQDTDLAPSGVANGHNGISDPKDDLPPSSPAPEPSTDPLTKKAEGEEEEEEESSKPLEDSQDKNLTTDSSELK